MFGVRTKTLQIRGIVFRFLGWQERHTVWVSLAGRICIRTKYSLV